MYKLLAFLVLLAATLAQDLETIIQQLQNGNAAGGHGTGQSTGQGTGQGTGQDSFNLQPQASTLVPPASNTATEDLSCTTESNQVGECVHYYLCDANNTLIDDGAGIIDIRVRDGPCQSYLDTCCLLSDQRQPDNPNTPAPPTKQREGCGWRNPDGLGFRITGGIDGESNFGEFPWMVAILRVEPVNENEPNGQKLNVYVGGGSLIHPSVVLTAAHYVAGGRALRVRAGEWDTQTKNELYPYQDRDVKETVVHKDFNKAFIEYRRSTPNNTCATSYNGSFGVPELTLVNTNRKQGHNPPKGNLFYDIGLLILAAPIDPAPNVGVACLPPPGQRAAGGTRCLASGWGKDVFGKEGRYQVILKRVDVPVIERTQCQELLRKTRLGKHFMLHSSFMCAGGEEGKDTCKGDGGSPLVCPSEFEADRYVQNGIVAWGIGCGNATTPAVYVDVANLRNWIDDKVAGHGFDPKVYTLD